MSRVSPLRIFKSKLKSREVFVEKEIFFSSRTCLAPELSFERRFRFCAVRCLLTGKKVEIRFFFDETIFRDEPKFLCRCGSSSVKLSRTLMFFCFPRGLRSFSLSGSPTPVLKISSNVSKSINFKPEENFSFLFSDFSLHILL